MLINFKGTTARIPLAADSPNPEMLQLERRDMAAIENLLGFGLADVWADMIEECLLLTPISPFACGRGSYLLHVTMEDTDFS